MGVKRKKERKKERKRERERHRQNGSERLKKENRYTMVEKKDNASRFFSPLSLIPIIINS